MIISKIYKQSWLNIGKRLPDVTPKNKIDGAWKRVYQINYVNGIPVDTTSVPNDAS